jgi:hypothetical protein
MDLSIEQINFFYNRVDMSSTPAQSSMSSNPAKSSMSSAKTSKTTSARTKLLSTVQIRFAKAWNDDQGTDAKGCKQLVTFHLTRRLSNQAEWDEFARQTLEDFRMWKEFREENNIEYDDTKPCCFMKQMVTQTRGRKAEYAQIFPHPEWSTVNNLAEFFDPLEIIYLWVPTRALAANGPSKRKRVHEQLEQDTRQQNSRVEQDRQAESGDGNDNYELHENQDKGRDVDEDGNESDQVESG